MTRSVKTQGCAGVRGSVSSSHGFSKVRVGLHGGHRVAPSLRRRPVGNEGPLHCAAIRIPVLPTINIPVVPATNIASSVKTKALDSHPRSGELLQTDPPPRAFVFTLDRSSKSRQHEMSEPAVSMPTSGLGVSRGGPVGVVTAPGPPAL